MAIAAVDVEIEIGQEHYSVVKIPSETSGVVTEQKKQILRRVDLKVSHTLSQCMYRLISY